MSTPEEGSGANVSLGSGAPGSLFTEEFSVLVDCWVVEAVVTELFKFELSELLEFRKIANPTIATIPINAQSTFFFDLKSFAELISDEGEILELRDSGSDRPLSNFPEKTCSILKPQLLQNLEFGIISLPHEGQYFNFFLQYFNLF
jgi:hypothetical protein